MDRCADSLKNGSRYANIEISDTTDSNSHNTIQKQYANISDIGHNESSTEKVATELKTEVPQQTTTRAQTKCDESCRAHENIVSLEKKPSYLNLACCVNGYSNLTTYDSKIRQDINKSREVSPIRPTSCNIQYCKTKNTLLPPVAVVSMPTENANRVRDSEKSVDQVDDGRNLTFIQQRVERLYGPGSLAQNFYSPKRNTKNSNSTRMKIESNDKCNSELLMKFQKLSPTSKTYKSDTNEHSNIITRLQSNTATNNSNKMELIDRPVFRHLSEEFRSQLPIYALKSETPSQPVKERACEIEKTSGNTEFENEKKLQKKDEVPVLNTNGLEKKGVHFLYLLQKEQERLLSLAKEAELWLDELTTNANISEDVFGVLRSASGKARLLVSQKMKQFEGLCHQNINVNPGDQFPTTDDDLQGFWDMINLQIHQIDDVFAEIKILKENDWKRPIDAIDSQVEPKTPKPIKSNSTDKSNATNGCRKPSAAAQRHEAQRKQLREMKRRNKMALENMTKPVTSVTTGQMDTTLE